MKEDLANIRRIEEQFLQTAQTYQSFTLTDLVAIFTRNDKQQSLAVFNSVTPPSIPGFSEILSLEQLLGDNRDLMEDYDGIVISFRALDLILPDLVTRGLKFYPMGQFYKRVHQ